MKKQILALILLLTSSIFANQEQNGAMKQEIVDQYQQIIQAMQDCMQKTGVDKNTGLFNWKVKEKNLKFNALRMKKIASNPKAVDYMRCLMMSTVGIDWTLVDRAFDKNIKKIDVLSVEKNKFPDATIDSFNADILEDFSAR